MHPFCHTIFCFFSLCFRFHFSSSSFILLDTFDICLFTVCIWIFSDDLLNDLMFQMKSLQVQSSPSQYFGASNIFWLYWTDQNPPALLSRRKKKYKWNGEHTLLWFSLNSIDSNVKLARFNLKIMATHKSQRNLRVEHCGHLDNAYLLHNYPTN